MCILVVVMVVVVVVVGLVAYSIDEWFCVSLDMDMKSKLGDCVPLLGPLSMCSATGE